MRDFKSFGQDRVFRFWHELSPSQRERLIRQAGDIDLELAARLTEKYIAHPESKLFTGTLEPAEIIRIPQSREEHRCREEARGLGERALRDSRVAAVLVAGGQATRLGYKYPKGMYPAGPISGKSLFQLHSEKLTAMAQRHRASIPFYIMTSDANHDETQQFFAEHAYFTIPQNDVVFFKQGMIPGLDEQGRFFLDSKDHIFVNPDGHGGCLSALKRSGALDDMRGRGIELLYYFQVDNVLNIICDPVFLGYHILKRADMSVKVVKKQHPLEKVGLIGRLNGRLAVIEYSDMPDEKKEAREADGSLTYWAGSIAIHVFNLDFIEEENKGGLKLPYHVAHKKIAYVDESGRHIEPDAPNGYKFEQFVFDALGDARGAAIMEVARSEEFSPIKNSEGENSPETARHDLMQLHAKWLEAAGYPPPRDSEGKLIYPVEISPRYALEAGDLIGKLPSTFTQEGALYLDIS